MNTFNNELLKKCRKDKGYTQESFAERIGIARTTYAEYEQGKIQPPIDKIQRICRILRLSQDDLVVVSNDTGIDVTSVKFKKIIPDSEKIIRIQQLQEREKALSDLERIMNMVANSSIEPNDKNIISSLLEYMHPAYELTPADIDIKKRIELAIKRKEKE